MPTDDKIAKALSDIRRSLDENTRQLKAIRISAELLTAELRKMNKEVDSGDSSGS